MSNDNVKMQLEEPDHITAYLIHISILSFANFIFTFSY